MRVLTVGNMYPPHHLGGYELVWQSAVEHLRAAGHEVSVLTTDHRQGGVSEADPPFVHRDLRWWWRAHAWPEFTLAQRVRTERHNARVFAARVQADAPDVVAWFAMGGMSLGLIERARRRGLPAVGVVHDDWLVYGPRVDAWLRTWDGPRRSRVAGAVERVTRLPTRVDFPAAATWLFVSEYVRRQAPALARTAVLPSGIDHTWVGAPAPEQDWDWRLLNVGRLDTRKGIDTAIRALALLPAEARLTLAGDGDDRVEPALRALAAQHGLGERVDFLGGRSREELRAIYAAADVVVFPVRWQEPWGLVPLEAMATGRPVVATGRGGSAEYLRDGENCLLFEADDPAALAAAVRRLAEDPALRARLRDGGARTAPRYTDERFNAGLTAALEEAAGG